MNKKIILAVFVVALLAAGAYFFVSRPKETPPPSQSTSKIVSEYAQWANAIESGKPTTCVMVRGTDKMEYYIEGQKMRADITSVVEAKTQLSHMINDGSYLYIWVDGEARGTKMTIPSEEEIKNMSEKAQQYKKSDTTPDFADSSAYDSLQTQGYTINCNSFSATPTRFTPPATVSFFDPSEMMKAVVPQDGSAGVDMEKLQEMVQQYQTQE